MTTKKDGGPAFPGKVEVPPFPGFHTPGVVRQAGMSLLDYYAGQALAGLCSNPGGPFQRCDASGWTLVNCTEDQVADECFRLANAMLKEPATAGQSDAAEQLVAQIEARFPDWRSYRDLVDCIDCTLHQLRSDQ